MFTTAFSTRQLLLTTAVTLGLLSACSPSAATGTTGSQVSTAPAATSAPAATTSPAAAEAAASAPPPRRPLRPAVKLRPAARQPARHPPAQSWSPPPARA